MRKIIFVLTSLCVFAATPGWASSRGAARLARRVIVSHRLLTPQQLACSSFVYGHKAIREATEVIVFERRGGRCPGDPRLPPRARFDLFVDAVSGAVQWDFPDRRILEDVPVPGAPPTIPSVLTSCGVCAHF